VDDLVGPPALVTVAAVGDVLPHGKVKRMAARDGWATVFGDTGAVLGAADVAFANLESPVAPDVPIPLHDEVFDAPATLPPALAALGIDVVSMANNHAFDQGPEGIVETWTRVHAAGLGAVGAGPTLADATAPWITTVRGVRIGFLAFCDLSNIDGNTTADAPSVFVSGPVCTGDCGADRDAVHYAIDLDRLRGAIDAARPLVDVLVVSAHWGNEYRTTPLPEYPPLARQLVDAGADVILGHHPHVLQPVARIRGDSGREGVVAYSLGNFVSNMAESWTPANPKGLATTRDGVILRLALAVWPDGRVEAVAVEPVPVWTDNHPDSLAVRTHAGLAATGDEGLRGLVTARRAVVDAILGPGVATP
jgi:poly-gamma-glutamate capsule biosynthesis protein CapA/YwtB (metallophosphatase superfamily)